MKLMYINGQYTRGNSTQEIAVTNPATEEVLDTVPRGTAEDDSCHCEGWWLSSPERLLRRAYRNPARSNLHL